ncbi:MAG: hypothetical protein HZA48_13180 [Planctomycetes bacterium]|nr:hypothetical protein [Planctomycetota bacterium]
MNNKTFFVAIGVACLFCILSVTPALAKTSAPKEVTPVTHNGVKFTAPHDKMGFVAAYDEKTGKQLWETKVYDVPTDPALEQDVQMVFITELKVTGNSLIVTNDRHNTYAIDITNPLSPGNPELVPILELAPGHKPADVIDEPEPAPAIEPAPRPEPASEPVPAKSNPSSTQSVSLISVLPLSIKILVLIIFLIVLIFAGTIAYYLFLRKH